MGQGPESHGGGHPKSQICDATIILCVCVGGGGGSPGANFIVRHWTDHGLRQGVVVVEFVDDGILGRKGNAPTPPLQRDKQGTSDKRWEQGCVSRSRAATP